MIKWEQEIRRGLKKSLPAHNSHSKVMNHRKAIDKLGNIPITAKQSAVLLLLYPKNNETHVVFILRPTYEGVHSAQIGLPGGKVEKEDKTLLDTALREAKEELSIDKNKIEILGQLSSLYVPPSNFVIHPFVAVQSTKPDFVPDKFEVAEIIEQPLEQLLALNALTDFTISTQGTKIKTKGFEVQGRILWGATAMILQELVDIVHP